MATKAQEKDTHVDVMEVEKGQLTYFVLGTNPIILNRMSQKTLHELLLPSGRKTAAERQSTLKHDPFTEFRASPYILRDDPDVYLGHLASAFKGAMCTAALDLPGARKAQIGRLVYVEGDLIGLYGLPKLFMSVVRSADMNRTPDVRSRVIIPRWAAKITISFVSPLIRGQAVSNLLAAAGITAGIGDWRPEKGKGDYGQFRLVGAEDPEWLAIVAEGGRKAQIAAMENPEPYDLETEELMGWYGLEVQKRGFKSATSNGVHAEVTA